MIGWRVGKSESFGGLQLALLLPWLVALVSYFAPWVARRPVSAALAWNAYDLFDLLRFLPEIESGALAVNLQALRLPLVGLAVLLPTLLAESGRPVRIAGALFGCLLAILTLPPYPQILDAWRTPGWRVPLWWGAGAMACALLSIWLAPKAGRYRHWWILAVAELATVPAAVTLARLLPALRTLHAAPVRTGWGFWGCMAGLAVIGLSACAMALRSSTLDSGNQDLRAATEGVQLSHRPTVRNVMAKGGTMAETHAHPNQATGDLAHIRKVKAKYEAELLKKANVVAVGIGAPIRDGRPAGVLGIIVSVTHKVEASKLAPQDRLPEELEGVRVWVVEIDHPHAGRDTEPERD